MQILPINHQGFISALSQDAPSIILFRNMTDEHNKKSKQIGKIIAKTEDMPNAYFYEYIVDESDENQFLATTLEIPSGISMILYKNGCFNRYKLNPTTEKTIKSIWSAARVINRNNFSSVKKESSSDYKALET